MIIEAPRISRVVKQLLEKGREMPIKRKYPSFAECFVMLHPFLKIKDGHQNKIDFKTEDWPKKDAIVNHCEPMNWKEFIGLSGIRGYSSLDRVIAFEHYAYGYAERKEYEKLSNFTAPKKPQLIISQVNGLPAILEDKILTLLANRGNSELYVYIDTDTEKQIKPIDSLVSDPQGLPWQVRLETLDGKVLIAQDFDQRFSYILSDKEFIEEAVQELDLEGFYCMDNIPESWSFKEIANKERVEHVKGWDINTPPNKGSNAMAGESQNGPKVGKDIFYWIKRLRK